MRRPEEDPMLRPAAERDHLVVWISLVVGLLIVTAVVSGTLLALLVAELLDLAGLPGLHLPG